jgi:hypothetical protein
MPTEEDFDDTPGKLPPRRGYHRTAIDKLNDGRGDDGDDLQLDPLGFTVSKPGSIGRPTRGTKGRG